MTVFMTADVNGDYFCSGFGSGLSRVVDVAVCNWCVWWLVVMLLQRGPRALTWLVTASAYYHNAVLIPAPAYAANTINTLTRNQNNCPPPANPATVTYQLMRKFDFKSFTKLMYLNIMFYINHSAINNSQVQFWSYYCKVMALYRVPTAATMLYQVLSTRTMEGSRHLLNKVGGP